MNSIDILTEESLKHTDLVYEYCTLALQETLTESQAERLTEIFEKAQSDALLSFWIDEADHLIAHRLNLIDEEFVKQQQSRLRQSIRQTWINSLWNDLQNRTKALQTYLKHQGFYKGEIDGICGPSTQEAMQRFERLCPNGLQRLRWGTSL